MQRFIDSIRPTAKWKNFDPADSLISEDKPLLLYFWRSHTPESVETLHQIDSLNKKHASDFPVNVIAIHAPEFDEEEDMWEALVDHLGIDIPVLHDEGYHVWEEHNMQHSPGYIILDNSGDEVLRRVGLLEDSGIQEYIYSLMS